jgi:hypothetical protein
MQEEDRDYGGYNAEVATGVSYSLQDLRLVSVLRRAEQPVYSFSASHIRADFSSIPLPAPGVVRDDLVESFVSSPDFVDAALDSVHIFLPERGEELTWVRTAFFGGRSDEAHRTDQPDGPLPFIARSVAVLHQSGQSWPHLGFEVEE